MDKRELITQNFEYFTVNAEIKRQSGKYFKAEERNNKSRLNQQIDFRRR